MKDDIRPRTKADRGVTNVPLSIESRRKLNLLAKTDGRLQRYTLELLIDQAFVKKGLSL